MKPVQAAHPMKTIYMAHPVSAPSPEGIAANLARARRWYRWCIAQRVAVSAGWILECELYDDADPEQREAGLRRDCEAVSRCDELWLVGGRVSGGMRRERGTALDHCLPIIDWTPLGPEPPECEVSKLQLLTRVQPATSAAAEAFFGDEEQYL